jgi:hypothetical protein
MLAVEREFSAAIYCLYFIDCLHWLKPGQVALTRKMNGGWKRWEYREVSFTLLGRMPVFSNPFDLRPGWILFDAEPPLPETESAELIDSILNKQLPRRAFLLEISVLAALNLLVLLPGIVLEGSLRSLWLAPALLMAFTHVVIAFEVFDQAKQWRKSDRSSFWQEYLPLLLNPIGALRCADMLSRGVFAVVPRGNVPIAPSQG